MNGHGSFILGVDLDGVCADYTEAFAAVVAAEKGCHPDDLPRARSWSFEEWGIEELGGFERLHRIAVLDTRIFRSMPVIEGCAETLWRLSDAGVWIRIITHRLVVNWGHQVAVADTVAWLDASGLPYRDLCFLGAKPEIEADCYIDDAPHNVEALRARGNDVLVFDQPYNGDVAGPRVHSWPEVEEVVLVRMADRGLPVQGQFPGVTEAATRLRHRLAPDGD